MKYAVTGATGAFGSLAVQHLLAQKVPAASVVAIVRDGNKAQTLKSQGVDVRVADYNDPAALKVALHGVDRLLLVSASDPGHRFDQHRNALEAAKAAGVSLIAYTSAPKATTSQLGLAPDHKATEELLAKLGVPFIILRNNWYAENYAGDVAGAKSTGSIAAAVTTGKVGSVLRTELAEAAVKALIGGTSGKIYELGGTPWSFQEFAATLSTILGKPVTFQSISVAEKAAMLEKVGLPAPVAGFFAAIDADIQAGCLDVPSPDLATLLGRQPAGLADQIRALVG